MYLTLIWVLQIPTSVCLDIEGLGSLSDDEISLNISKYITTLNSRLGSTVGVLDANSSFIDFYRNLKLACGRGRGSQTQPGLALLATLDTWKIIIKRY